MFGSRTECQSLKSEPARAVAWRAASYKSGPDQTRLIFIFDNIRDLIIISSQPLLYHGRLTVYLARIGWLWTSDNQCFSMLHHHHCRHRCCGGEICLWKVDVMMILIHVRSRQPPLELPTSTTTTTTMCNYCEMICEGKTTKNCSS